MPSFAAIGLDHRHIYDLTAGLLEAGARCIGHDPQTTDPRVLAGFRKRFPDVPAMERERLLDLADFVVLAAVPRDRAALRSRQCVAARMSWSTNRALPPWSSLTPSSPQSGTPDASGRWRSVA